MLLNISDIQANVIKNACEFYSRVFMGQIKYIADILMNEIDLERICKLRQELERLEPLITGLPPNASWGITSREISEDARISFDILQVIRHYLAWKNHPQGGVTVNFHTPLKTACEDLPIIEPKLNLER